MPCDETERDSRLKPILIMNPYEPAIHFTSAADRHCAILVIQILILAASTESVLFTTFSRISVVGEAEEA
jgi:hypothetical protein